MKRGAVATKKPRDPAAELSSAILNSSSFILCSWGHRAWQHLWGQGQEPGRLRKSSFFHIVLGPCTQARRQPLMSSQRARTSRAFWGLGLATLSPKVRPPAPWPCHPIQDLPPGFPFPMLPWHGGPGVPTHFHSSGLISQWNLPKAFPLLLIRLVLPRPVYYPPRNVPPTVPLPVFHTHLLGQPVPLAPLHRKSHALGITLLLTQYLLRTHTCPSSFKFCKE